MKATSRCRWCKEAEVVWRLHVDTGKPAPIDATPTEDGNIVLVEGGLYRIARADDDPAVPRFLNHFVTCPRAHEREAFARREHRFEGLPEDRPVRLLGQLELLPDDRKAAQS